MLSKIDHVSGASLCEETGTHTSSRLAGDLGTYSDKLACEMGRNIVMWLENESLFGLSAES